MDIQLDQITRAEDIADDDGATRRKGWHVYLADGSRLVILAETPGEMAAPSIASRLAKMAIDFLNKSVC